MGEYELRVSTWYKCMIFRMLCRELNEMRLEYVLKCRERYVKLNLTIGLKCDIDISALKKRRPSESNSLVVILCRTGMKA